MNTSLPTPGASTPDTAPVRAPDDAPVAGGGQALQLTAADGTVLAATLFAATGPHWIVVGGATAVPRGFYRRFAEHAQARGVNVLTLDYRGIGGSAPASLRGYLPDYVDWARQDLAAALAYAQARGEVFLVGHSYGGHAIGLLPVPQRQALRAAYVVAGGAGWHGWMPWREQLKVQLLWHVVGPLATTLLGYQPLKRLGIGEDLPVSIYRQWKQWCRHPNYFFGDPEAAALTRPFADVRLPIAAANALDDWWALPASRDAFFAGFVNAPLQRIDIDAAAEGLSGIGHMGYFRPAVGKVLWPRMLGWLRGHGLQVED
jgi:predicted alpha/beta hydrolase